MTHNLNSFLMLIRLQSFYCIRIHIIPKTSKKRLVELIYDFRYGFDYILSTVKSELELYEYVGCLIIYIAHLVLLVPHLILATLSY